MKLTNHLNVNGYQLKSAAMECVDTEPTSNFEGRFGYNRAKAQAGFYDGTSWQYFLTTNGVSPTLPSTLTIMERANRSILLLSNTAGDAGIGFNYNTQQNSFAINYSDSTGFANKIRLVGSSGPVYIGESTGNVVIGSASEFDVNSKLQLNGQLNLNSHKAVGMAAPFDDTDGANKVYVDSKASKTAQVEVDFGATVSDSAKIIYTASWITPASIIVCSLAMVPTADHDADDYVLEELRVMPGVPVNGSVDIYCVAPYGTYGKYRINIIGA